VIDLEVAVRLISRRAEPSRFTSLFFIEDLRVAIIDRPRHEKGEPLGSASGAGIQVVKRGRFSRPARQPPVPTSELTCLIGIGRSTSGHAGGGSIRSGAAEMQWRVPRAHEQNRRNLARGD